MKTHLALLFYLSGALSEPHSDALSADISIPDRISGSRLENRSGTHIAKIATPETRDIPSGSAVTKKRDEPAQDAQMYSVWVTDERNHEQINKTLKWLEGVVQDKSKISPMTIFPWEDPTDVPDDELDELWKSGKWDEEIHKYEVTLGWTSLLLDSAGYETVSKRTDWIKSIEARSNFKAVEMSPVPSLIDEPPERLSSRKVEWGDWEKQAEAGRDLVQTSRYEGSNFDDMKNYVYERRGGREVFVYVIDRGVQVDVKNEHGEKIFKGFEDENDRYSILETRLFINQAAPHNKRWDHSSSGHGTKVASKIVGLWGTAKDAILVPVQVENGNPDDIPFGVGEAYGDFMRRRSAARSAGGEEPKALIVMSYVIDRNGERGFTRDEAQATHVGKNFLKYMRLATSRGIPIVVASGNYGDIQGREMIDTMPAVFEDADLPIINVGATTLEGKAWPKTQGKGSQDGTQLTIYAVGENVEVHDNHDGEAIRDSGTSLAAPAVGGVLAVHMNYQPWDRSKVGLDRVKEIKRWIRTSESSWERIKTQDPNKPEFQVNMIWNGADQAAHQKTEEDNTSKPSTPAPETKNEERTFVIGLEQIGFPHCSTITPPGINTTPIRSCTAKPDFQHSLFFYSLEHTDEVESLCTSELHDFWKAEPGAVGDTTPFDKPSWPAGEWKVKLFGEDFVYNNDGKSPGALWKNGRKIDCNGNLENHDPKSDEWCEVMTNDYSGQSRKRRRLLACKW